ncbi:calpain-2 catalytic subunit-like [Scomber japonicus]|uniref:calpain-2 catalytic subunit-like n=1 Tax=Scomber japonicus TaxID=13676 RepID=UPI0023060163|nr:calpain-2 catalytic subunit-like [Scomber japonicus]
MSETGTCTSIINLRYQDGSEGSPTNPAKFNNQDYEQLKSYSSRRDRLFVDRTFPPDNRSLGDLPDMPSWKENKVEWLRPKDVLKAQGSSEDPSFSLKGASRFDFGQGSVGNCWFLAAISALTFQKGLMAQVVPMDQSFRNYSGIFHFRFWRFGKWVDVVIDDHLPTLNGQLLSVRSKGGNEFWAPLLEKAYAKVCGTYADMNAGLPSEACKDFCGGVHMTFELSQVHDYSHDDKLWLQLSRATGCKSMICCGTAPKGGEIVNTVATTGLVDAHAYSVTGVTEVELYGSKKRLVRCMNPWGSQEWSGDWSDKSKLWDRVSPDDRAKCSDREDGEFWMELEDFCRYFNMMSICCENPNFLDGDLTCQWKCMIYDGKWEAGRTAGGRSSTGSFAKNPQYRINVTKINKNEENDMNILISLMQKPQLEGRKDAQKRYHAINVSVYKVPEGTRSGRLPSSFFNRNRPMNLRQMYAYQREKIAEYSLELGEYVIVPSTYKAHQNAEFVLTVFSKADSKITPHDHDDDDDDDHHHSDDEDEDVPKPSTDHDDDDDDDNDSDRALFKRYADQRGNLSARQLRKLLNDNFPHGTSYGFGLDTCRSMIAMMDTDRNWRMGFPEFSKLWTKINEYKTLFKRTDVNRNGSLQSGEVKEAIKSKGMDVNDFMVQMMMIRYSGSYTTMEDFIVLMLRLDKGSDIFNSSSSDGVITMSWEEWTSNMMYN